MDSKGVACYPWWFGPGNYCPFSYVITNFLPGEKAKKCTIDWVGRRWIPSTVEAFSGKSYQYILAWAEVFICPFTNSCCFSYVHSTISQNAFLFKINFFMEFVRTFIDIKCSYQVFWRKLIDLGGVRLCGWIQTFCGCLTWKRRHLHKIVSSLVWLYRSSYIKLLDAIGLLVDGQDSDVGRIYLKVTGKKIKLAWGNGWLQAHMMRRFFDLLSIW